MVNEIIEPGIKNNQTMTGRCFEVLAAGGFLLCEDNPMLKYFFNIKEDLDVFKNENRFQYLIKIYDSSEHGYDYHLKIFRIDYEKFQ